MILCTFPLTGILACIRGTCILGLVCCAALVAGCNQGYPSADVKNTKSMRTAEHMAALNRLLKADHDGGDRRLSIVDACTLQLSGVGSPSSPSSLRLALRSVTAAFDTDEATGHYLVLIRSGGKRNPRPTPIIDVGRWSSAVAFRAHLQELIKRCWGQRWQTEPA